MVVSTQSGSGVFDGAVRIIAAAVWASSIGNDGYSASSAAALAHRKEFPMKGDMGQEKQAGAGYQPRFRRELFV